MATIKKNQSNISREWSNKASPWSHVGWPCGSDYNAVFLSYTEMYGSILVTTPLRCCFAADVDAQTQSKIPKVCELFLAGGGGGNYVENLELWKARWSYKAPVTPTREADLSARISTDFPSS